MGKLLYNCFKKAVNIFCRLPEWIRNVQMIPGFSTRLDERERGWKSCMVNSKDWRSENVNMTELNCKVVKKVATPPFLHQPPFQVYPPFLAKNFIPSPQVTQFLEGPTPPPSPWYHNNFSQHSNTLQKRLQVGQNWSKKLCFNSSCPNHGQREKTN